MEKILYTEDTFSSPIGELLIITTEQGVYKLFHKEKDAALLAQPFPTNFQRTSQLANALNLAVIKELHAYFAGEKVTFRFPYYLVEQPAFRKKTLLTLAEVSYGTQITYQSLAKLAGNPQASRAAGSSCAHNPLPLLIPCHRVVRANKQLGNYRWGITIKQQLLQLETPPESR